MQCSEQRCRTNNRAMRSQTACEEAQRLSSNGVYQVQQIEELGDTALNVYLGVSNSSKKPVTCRNIIM
eukprot:scaffold355974_cov41-Prasinocladus_malaysianus.AAC.1